MSRCRYLHKLFWRGFNLETELRKASIIAGQELRALGSQVAALNTALSTTRSIKLKSNKHMLYCKGCAGSWIFCRVMQVRRLHGICVQVEFTGVTKPDPNFEQLGPEGNHVITQS